MDPILTSRLQRLIDSDQQNLICRGLKGVEKECLRITPDGRISQNGHPRSLGSALTHPYITTDYSEALLEFITPPCNKTQAALSFLRDIHQFVYDKLNDELLLATSMPCAISGDASIPIANYGTSNIGRMKHVYRVGLDHRYGRSMQTIAGIHFNYSLPEAFWPVFQDLEKNTDHLQDFIASNYFAMIRNLLRWGWIILFFFGASPAICKSFLKDRKSRQPAFDEFDKYTFFKPYATSLRMSDIGYKNDNQASLDISYNNLDEYISSLTRAIETPHPDYQKIGIRSNGEFRQLNSNILQIENEYYSTVRPKQVALSGEKPTIALQRRGVRYVEIRSSDIDLFSDIGVGEDRLYFLEALLLTCVLSDSPLLDQKALTELNQNLLAVAYAGRDPLLTLQKTGQPVLLKQWANDICQSMQAICEILDANETGRPYGSALEEQIEAIHDPDRTPSARILEEMRNTGEPFAEYAQRISQQYENNFKKQKLSAEKTKLFETVSNQSLQEQQQLEAEHSESFESFLDHYFNQQ